MYLFGNHDKRNYADNRVLLFSDVQNEIYEFKNDNMKFIVKHGDSKKLKYSFIKNVVQATHMSEKFFTKYCHEKLEHILVKIFGKTILQILFYKYNKVLKNDEAIKLKDHEMLICGHTHAATLDTKNHYANTGIIRHGIGQFITIENGKVKLHEEKY